MVACPAIALRPRVALLIAGPTDRERVDQPIAGTVVRQLLGRELPEVTGGLHGEEHVGVLGLGAKVSGLAEQVREAGRGILVWSRWPTRPGSDQSPRRRAGVFPDPGPRLGSPW
jgi:hypothetical protein